MRDAGGMMIGSRDVYKISYFWCYPSEKNCMRIVFYVSDDSRCEQWPHWDTVDEAYI